jgi:hypothetical protein
MLLSKAAARVCRWTSQKDKVEYGAKASDRPPRAARRNLSS